MDTSIDRPSFDRYGPAVPDSPVVLSVPHAGRDYPPELLAALAVPEAALLPLEDRLADRLAIAARGDETLFVARRPRAWIDLNRAEHERDPRIDDGASNAAAPYPSLKVRGGLGLIPRRASGATPIWRGRWSADAVAARIAADHRPYHSALAAALQAARARFGIAILLDVHSMPPLPDRPAPQVVIGDRFGRSAGARLVARLDAAARAHGVRTALNAPYAGGHILDRHGAPARDIHAVQLEVDRTLYLDRDGRTLGQGFAGAAALLRDMAAAVADEATGLALAAE
ncbi:N-formylglutamate amidohydrolase [Sphingomonas donggukensis]|uniref:N-formylglutamate amidohydrolase n=1 Tax=Sphingomonas donggukensis TaxID=2949093 RepID=A0ABY4TUJ2_9SPHN|nr:N-formylglutamate amidohydrolase [Sphingomonas donggukensis]URW76080.1 N-formylglutamate amidohydrolase [Sphingomonas donggukensis]